MNRKTGTLIFFMGLGVGGVTGRMLQLDANAETPPSFIHAMCIRQDAPDGGYTVEPYGSLRLEDGGTLDVGGIRTRLPVSQNLVTELEREVNRGWRRVQFGEDAGE